MHRIVTDDSDWDSNITPLYGWGGRDFMENLTEEYTDVRNIRHKVEHIVLNNEKDSRERILEELLNTLARPKNCHGKR